MVERWKAIPGYEGYEVSDMGRVRSYMKRCGAVWVVADRPQRILAIANASGYPTVCLRGQTLTVHRLVMLAFVGPLPDGMETCHNDGSPANNKLSNLRYDTPASNAADTVRHGRADGGKPKLDFDDACIVRRLASDGAPRRILADIYNVSITTINNICTGKSYKPHGAVDKLFQGRNDGNKTDSR